MNQRSIKFFIIGFAAFLLLLAATFYISVKMNLISGQAVISWQENKEKDLAGYRIYYGTSPRIGSTTKDSAYTDMVDTKLEHSYRFDKLSLFKTYYFSTTAYNKSGKESGLSEEVSKKIGIKDIFKK